MSPKIRISAAPTLPPLDVAIRHARLDVVQHNVVLRNAGAVHREPVVEPPAIQIGAELGAEPRIPGWEQSRDEVRAAIEQEGWNEDVGACTQVFGSTALDASSLLLGTAGFLERDDPRFRSAVEAIACRLTDERGPVYRYVGDGGLPGEDSLSTHSEAGSVFAPCQDTADVAVVAVSRIEMAAPLDEVLDLVLEHGELPASFAHFSQLGFEERHHVGAWSDAVVADVGDAVDFGQGEPGRLRGANEPELIECCRAVDPVAVGSSSRVGQETSALVEPDRTSR